ncbi:pyochelin biosynthetic protein PchC [Streptomyces cirratus]|uniref:Pyochelin biosynthetic protein PchC n=1 Tax=Streptomyces cirratus TaxID=68187 RepID=A0ABQ3F4D4_9ACTN|nr:alpha/beta fold hydrolase [Streptomyces cirratus]GHB75457.1 pyochelin biosynthetic protein PchC [Streptomyces cirratus]
MSAPNTLTLVCFPHAGGGLGRFRSWREELPDGVELVLPTLPGREGRLFDEPFPDVAAVSEYALRSLSERIAAGERLAFAGISYGALVAYDVAARLEAAGKPVEAVFAASQRAPSTPLPAINWRSMADAELLTELAGIGGLSPDLEGEEEFLELFLPTIRAELHASESYLRPESHERLRCPVFVYHGAADSAIPAASTLAWHDESDRLTSRSLPAAHFLTGPHEEDLWWQALRQDLAQVTTAV